MFKNCCNLMASLGSDDLKERTQKKSVHNKQSVSASEMDFSGKTVTVEFLSSSNVTMIAAAKRQFVEYDPDYEWNSKAG